MARLSGKTALVTAAGAGIGRASALAMLREGARVIATDVRRDALDDLAAAGCEVRMLDVRDPMSVAAAVQPVDVLFNCAGFVAAGTILDCDEETWDFSVDLNLKGMHRMCRAFLPGMLEQGHGSIINMASAVGSIIAAPNRYVYGATKAGVIGLTKAIAADFITRGIRCNAICPARWKAPASTSGCALPATTRPRARPLSRASPSGGSASPKRLRRWSSTFASDESSYTTGVAHVIDGGWTNT